MTGTPSETNRRRLLAAAGLLAGLGTGGTLTAGASGTQESGGRRMEPSTGATTPDESDGDGPGGTGTDRACRFDGPGLVTVESERCFEATVGAIQDRIEASPLSLLTTVDHAANADAVGKDLPPTTLLVFGNPTVGTELMQESRTAAIDLPQKVLVWRDGETVRVTYNEPEYLATRHGIEAREGLLETIATALRTVATGGESTSGANTDS